MDKARKKNIKKLVALVGTAVIVGVLAFMPLIAGQKAETDGPQASILSGTVQTGSISTKLVGGGTLAEEDAVAISVPSAVKLTRYLVSNGDTVSAGDALASVDRVTVMTAIAEVQETLDYLAEEIEAESKKDTDGSVAALAGGIVKILYATKGASVQDVMLEHGTLAVLSLDGLMAVDVTVESDLAAGTAVTVKLSEKTKVTGRVEKNLAGQMTVTVEDDDYAVGETVQIIAADGTQIGSGELYIYSPWNATAYAGTVSAVKVKAGERVAAGETLMKLKDTGYTATYQQLVSQRQKYEDMMLDLFQMYQTETAVAPCDGVVSGVDQDSLQLLAAGEQAYAITLLANSPNGDDATLYTNYVGQVTAVGQNGWALRMNPQSAQITDYMELSGVSLDTEAMDRLTVYDPAETVPVYELNNGVWTQIRATAVASGDVLLFASDDAGDCVWIVRIQKAQEEASKPGDSQGSAPDTSTDEKGDTDQNGGGSSSTGNFWSGTGGYPEGGMTEQTEAFELYGLELAEIAAVTPQGTVTMEIAIDELDITKLQLGMSAEIRIDALGGEKFSAAITEISNTGTNNGGNSKFAVELTWERSGDMLIGMNATATIVLETASDILTLPAEALVEEGTKTVVYTGYDQKKETLTDPVVVTAGVSDGETVQVVDGLSADETYYYAYYDTLEISVTPEFGGGVSMFGR